jgi:8-oxo-dGTP pyrophosphatase MutT (NUDIX family)
MKDIKISQLNKEPVVRFSNKHVILPVEAQEKIDIYWQSLLSGGKKYTRGEVFTVTQKKESDGILQILVEKIDYAHYLYCQDIDAELNGYGIQVIFTACLVETLDDKTIFGIMGKHTARAGIYQLSGGGIDNSDINDGVFDLRKNIKKELQEEIGVDVMDSERVQNFDAAYLKQGGVTKKIAVVYRVKLNNTSEEFLGKYNNFTKNLKSIDEIPEFEDIIILGQSRGEIDDFFEKNRDNCDEYLEPLLKYAYR